MTGGGGGGGTSGSSSSNSLASPTPTSDSTTTTNQGLTRDAYGTIIRQAKRKKSSDLLASAGPHLPPNPSSALLQPTVSRGMDGGVGSVNPEYRPGSSLSTRGGGDGGGGGSGSGSGGNLGRGPSSRGGSGKQRGKGKSTVVIRHPFVSKGGTGSSSQVHGGAGLVGGYGGSSSSTTSLNTAGSTASSSNSSSGMMVGKKLGRESSYGIEGHQPPAGVEFDLGAVSAITTGAPSSLTSGVPATVGVGRNRQQTNAEGSHGLGTMGGGVIGGFVVNSSDGSGRGRASRRGSSPSPSPSRRNRPPTTDHSPSSSRGGSGASHSNSNSNSNSNATNNLEQIEVLGPPSITSGGHPYPHGISIYTSTTEAATTSSPSSLGVNGGGGDDSLTTSNYSRPRYRSYLPTETALTVSPAALLQAHQGQGGGSGSGGGGGIGSGSSSSGGYDLSNLSWTAASAGQPITGTAARTGGGGGGLGYYGSESGFGKVFKTFGRRTGSESGGSSSPIPSLAPPSSSTGSGGGSGHSSPVPSTGGFGRPRKGSEGALQNMGMSSLREREEEVDDAFSNYDTNESTSTSTSNNNNHNKVTTKPPPKAIIKQPPAPMGHYHKIPSIPSFNPQTKKSNSSTANQTSPTGIDRGTNSIPSSSSGGGGTIPAREKLLVSAPLPGSFTASHGLPGMTTAELLSHQATAIAAITDPSRLGHNHSFSISSIPDSKPNSRPSSGDDDDVDRGRTDGDDEKKDGGTEAYLENVSVLPAPRTIPSPTEEDEGERPASASSPNSSDSGDLPSRSSSSFSSLGSDVLTATGRSNTPNNNLGATPLSTATTPPLQQLQNRLKPSNNHHHHHRVHHQHSRSDSLDQYYHSSSSSGGGLSPSDISQFASATGTGLHPLGHTAPVQPSAQSGWPRPLPQPHQPGGVSLSSLKNGTIDSNDGSSLSVSTVGTTNSRGTAGSGGSTSNASLSSGASDGSGGVGLGRAPDGNASLAALTGYVPSGTTAQPTASHLFSSALRKNSPSPARGPRPLPASTNSNAHPVNTATTNPSTQPLQNVPNFTITGTTPREELPEPVEFRNQSQVTTPTRSPDVSPSHSPNAGSSTLPEVSAPQPYSAQSSVSSSGLDIIREDEGLRLGESRSTGPPVLPGIRNGTGSSFREEFDSASIADTDEDPPEMEPLTMVASIASGSTIRPTRRRSIQAEDEEGADTPPVSAAPMREESSLSLDLNPITHSSSQTSQPPPSPTLAARSLPSAIELSSGETSPSSPGLTDGATLEQTLSQTLAPFFQRGGPGHRISQVFSASDAAAAAARGSNFSAISRPAVARPAPQPVAPRPFQMAQQQMGATGQQRQQGGPPGGGGSNLLAHVQGMQGMGTSSSGLGGNALPTLGGSSSSTPQTPSFITSSSTSANSVPASALPWGAGGRAGPLPAHFRPPNPDGELGGGQPPALLAHAMRGGGSNTSTSDGSAGEMEMVLGKDGRPMINTHCPCCSTSLRHDASSPRFRCSICEVVTDLRESNAAATTTHRPITPSEIIAMRKRIEHITPIARWKGKEPAQDFTTAPETRAAVEQDNSQELLQVAERVKEVYSDLRALQASFFKEESTSKRSKPTLDLDALDSLYELCKLYRPIGVALLTGMETLVKRPGTAIAEFDVGIDPHDAKGKKQSKKDTRWMWWAIILLESPILQSSSKLPAPRRRFILSRLLGLISNLSNNSHHHLVSFYASLSLPPSRFQSKVDLVNALLSENIAHLPGWAQEGYRTDWGVRSGARVLALFWAANMMSHKVPVQAFYNVAVDALGPAIMIADFDLWLSRTTQHFCFCQYPFLLSMGHKQALLAYECAQQIGRKTRDAFMRGIAQRQFISPFLVLQVRRDRLIEDSLRQLSAHDTDLQKGLKVKFADEEGVDAGGLKKEWFLLLSRQLFDPQYGMFVYDEDSGLCWLNPASHERDDFYLVGVVLGLAILNIGTLDLPLSLAVYKKLLGHPVGLEDLEQVRPGLARGFRQMLTFDGNVEDTFCRTFVGEFEAFGEVHEIPLVEGGGDIPVTNDNRKEYVKRYCHWYLNDSVAAQFEAFKKGFDKVTRPGAVLSLMRGQELELLIRGSVEDLNIEELKAVTVYENFQDGGGEVIEWFWSFFHSLPQSRQRKLLSFITGSDRIPATGISGLKLKITYSGPDPGGRCPVSHTCFNQLCLYGYQSKETFEERMDRAIDESEGFGLK